MPTHLFVGIIVTVLFAAGLTVAVAYSVGPVSFAWILVPLAIAVGFRIWSKSQG